MEIMVVLIIIGLVTALVGPNVMKRIGDARQKTAFNQIKLLSSAVKDYYLDMDEYPQRLSQLLENSGNKKWDGPYLDPAKIPLDPWGNEYEYIFPGQHGAFDIISYGADKSPGGEKANADIVSWE